MKTKLLILYAISIFGGLGLGIVSDFKGRTLIGDRVRKVKEKIFSNLSGWARFCLEYVSIFVFIFGPLYIYILFFPNDYPLWTVFRPIEIVICLFVNVLVGRIVRNIL